MAKIEAKKIVRNYAKKLREENYPFSAIYLFGSHAKGTSCEWSDIDVAIISDKLKRNRDKNENLLWHIRRDVDVMIEPYGFTIKDFQDECNPIVSEIKKTGIKIV